MAITVAAAQVVLGRGAADKVATVPLHTVVHIVGHLVVLTVHHEVAIQPVGGRASVLPRVVAPVAALGGSPLLVDVVGVAHQSHAGVVGESGGKEAGHVAVGLRSPLSIKTFGSGDAAASLEVAHVANAVLALQLHVHHILLLLHVAAQELATLGGLVEHLHLLHRVVGQILQHHLVLSLEKVFSVQGQIIDLTPIHLDFAIVVQFHPVHLTEQAIEHGAFGHIEGIGIIDEGVATVGNAHLCGLDHHFVQFSIHVGELGLLGPPLHVVPRSVEEGVALDVADIEVHIGVFVVGMFGLDDEPLHHDGHTALVGGIVTDAWLWIAPHTGGVEHGAVGTHNGDFHIANALLRERVAHVPPHGDFTFAFLCRTEYATHDE